jgi:hypothetical protein
MRHFLGLEQRNSKECVPKGVTYHLNSKYTDMTDVALDTNKNVGIEINLWENIRQILECVNGELAHLRTCEERK